MIACFAGLSLTGFSLEGKPGVVFSLLGAIPGSAFLLIESKPWELDKKRLKQLRSQRGKISRLYEVRSQHVQMLEKIGQFKDIDGKISQLKQQEKILNSEVTELQKLSNEIAATAESDAIAVASKIKQDAQSEAARIIEATKQSLNSTVYEPEKNAHLMVLQQVQEEKQCAIAELERVLKLQEKTREAIEKMKQSAQQEHANIKKKLQEQAKAQFLKEMEKYSEVIDQLNNQLALLTTENQMLRSEIESLDEPVYPEGYREHEVYARGVIDFYKLLGIKLDYKISFREGDRIVVRVIPRDEKVGEQQLRKFHDRLQRKFDLTQLPQIVTTAGCIQFDLRLMELQNPVVELLPIAQSPIPNSQYPTLNTQQLPQSIHPEIVDISEMRSHLERAQQREFIPPNTRFSPYSPITQTEKDWVLWLYNFCRIPDQNTIIYTVWQNTRGKGVSNGVGQSYLSAREKLHKIFDEAGIPRKRSNNAKEKDS